MLIFPMNQFKYLFEESFCHGGLHDGILLLSDFFYNESILNIQAEKEYPGWCMYFEGAVNIHEDEIGTILIFPTDATSRWPHYSDCAGSPTLQITRHVSPI